MGLMKSLHAFAAAVLIAVLPGCGGSSDEIKSIEKIDDLNNSKIGLQLGTIADLIATDIEKENSGNTTVIRYNKTQEAVLALTQGKIDAVIVDSQPAAAYVQNNNDLKIVDVGFEPEDYALVIAKNRNDLKHEVEQAIAELKNNGVLAKIVDSYIGPEGNRSPRYAPEQIPDDHFVGKLRVGTNATFPPYEFFEGGKTVGIDIDIMRAISDKMKMRMEIVEMEFDSIIMAVQTGKIDIGAAGFTITEERKKNVDFSTPYTQSKQVVIVRAGSADASGSIAEKFQQSFIDDDRWKFIAKGLWTTIVITVFSGIIGVTIGLIVANVRLARDRADSRSKWLAFADWVCRVYVTVFRGVPMMIQQLLVYYVAFASTAIDPVVAAIVAFGLNAGAYSSEAIRAGLLSVDIGQFEAGRSLGFTYTQTLRYIVIPQSMRTALPAMCNEFIALLKESAIVGYIGLIDLTRAGDIIRSTTYEAFMPLMASAIIYLAIVMFMTAMVAKLEKRLKKYAK